MFKYDYTVPETRQVRYIVHTDCANEADDQYTLAHCLMTPYMDVKGVIAAHFARNFAGRTDTAKQSYNECDKIMKLMHVRDEYPLLLGANEPMSDECTPVDSEGARFIIQEAMKDDKRPLYIGLQGSLTDLASAIVMEPKICERMTAIWIGGGIYPKGGHEFNLMQDVAAANVVFKSQMPVWQVPMNVYKKFAVSLAELQHKVAPYGEIGRYLFEQMVDFNNEMGKVEFPWPHGELWGLGDEGVVAALMCEAERTDLYEEISAPTFDYETLCYKEGLKNKTIRVFKDMDTRLCLEDLFSKLAINFPKNED